MLYLLLKRNPFFLKYNLSMPSSSWSTLIVHGLDRYDYNSSLLGIAFFDVNNIGTLLIPRLKGGSMALDIG